MNVARVPVVLRAVCKSSDPYQAEFLIDWRSMNSIAPANQMKNAGIKPDGITSHELADGTTAEYPFAAVVIEFMGQKTGGRVIFGPDNAQPVLGVTALASVGIVIDPANNELKRLPAIPLKGLG